MDHLPVEILSMIFQVSDSSDVASFRLVCRRFSSVGIQYLEIGKHFYFRLHSINRLKNIANHPVLSKSISELVFFVNALAEFDSEGEWIEQAQGACCTAPRADDQLSLVWLQRYSNYQVVPMNSPSMPKAFIQSARKDHKAIRKEQEALLADLESNPHQFYLAFSKLSNLKSFSVESFGPYHREIMRCLYALRPRKQSWYCFNYRCSPSSFAEILHPILAPVLDGQSKVIFPCLEALNISATDFRDFNGLTPNVSNRNSSLCHLRTISLHSIAMKTRLPERLYSHVPASDNEDIGLFCQRLFMNSPKLDTIILSNDGEPGMNLQTIFSNRDWNNLKHLDLSWVEIEISTLEAFLSAHSKSIQIISMFTVIMHSASTQHPAIWIDFLKFLEQTMNLVEFEIGGELGDSDGILFAIEPMYCSNTQGEEVPLNRIIRYLICGKACARNRAPDESADILLNWHDLSWVDVETELS